MLGFNRSDLKYIVNFTRINIHDKYLGSALGIFWAVANPLMLLAIFTFIFGFVFKSKLPGAETSLSYVVWLVSGYGPWLASTEAIMAGALSVVSAAGMVKNMAFKTEVLPVAAVLTGVVPLLVSLCFVAIIMIIDGQMPTWHIIFIPFTIIVQFFFIISLSFILSAVVVFVRDIGIMLPNLLMMILFLTPIFYQLSAIPRIMQLASIVNPFYILSEGYRVPLVYHQVPNLVGLAYVVLLSLLLSYFGLKIFRRLKGHFNAVL